MTTNKFSIRESSIRLEVSEMYLRKMISEGKIQTTQEKVSNSDKVWKHMISEEELLRFKMKTSTKTSRKDNRNKFTIYLTTKEETLLREFLKENLIEVDSLLSRSNPSK
jgi:hypothetical protein